MQLELAALQLGHLGCFLHQMVQTIALLIDDRQKLLLLRILGLLRAEQVCDSGLDGGERRAKIVRNGIEQGGFQALPLAFRFRFAQLLDRAGALDGNRNKRADGVESLPGEPRAGNSQAADGLHTQADRKEVECLLGLGDDFVAQIGGFHLFFIELRRAVAGTIELVLLRHEEFRGARLEAFHDVVGNGVHQLNHVARPEELLAEFVEAFHLTPPIVRGIRFLPDARGELAAHNGCEQERKKRYPILRVCDRKGSRRGQKVEVKQQHRADGHEHRDNHAPDRGNC